MADILRNSGIDILSFLLVDAVFKQYIRSAGYDVTLKRFYWLREFYVLSVFTVLLYLVDHVPYLLSGLTLATYLFTQYPINTCSSKAGTSCEPSSCTCKVPGNVSFRSPIAAKKRVSYACDSPFSSTRKQVSDIFRESGQGDKCLTPFTSFKGHFKGREGATSTPAGRGKLEPFVLASNSPSFSSSRSGLPNLKRRITAMVTGFRDVLHLMMNNFVNYPYNDVINRYLSPVKPFLQSKIPPSFTTSVSAIRSLCLLFIENQEFIEMLGYDLSLTDKSHDSSVVFLTEFLNQVKFSRSKNGSNARDLTDYLDRNMFSRQIFKSTVQLFPQCFLLEEEKATIMLQTFGDFLLNFIRIVCDKTTNACRERTEEVAIRMRHAVKQTTSLIESCDGVFSGDFHCQLSKLSLAECVLQRTLKGKSSISALFEGKTVDVMYCSTCDSFAYEFRPFTLFNLDILVMPKNQAKKIATVADCLAQYTSPKPMLRYSPAFQCSCFDSSDRIGRAVDQSTDTSEKHVSFTLGNETESSMNPGYANRSSGESVHIRRTHFSQLPTYFAIDLNRFAPDGGVSDSHMTSRELAKTINHLQIPLDGLNLYDFSLAKQAVMENPDLSVQREEFEYKLHCVIAHDGYTFDDGQYITYLRSETESWFKVTSDSVLNVNMSYELCTKFLRENAALLVYKKTLAAHKY